MLTVSRILGSAVALSQLLLSGKHGEEGMEVLKQAGLPGLYCITEDRLTSKENLVLEGIQNVEPVKARL